MCESFVTFGPAVLQTGQQPTAMRNYNVTPEQKERSIFAKRPDAPCMITDFSDVPVRQIRTVACASDSVFILTDCGALFSWGSAARSGHGILVEKPARIETLSPHVIVDVAAGFAHILCCSTDGKLFTWGSDANALGHGANVHNIPIPSAVEYLNGTRVCAVACSQNNSFVITFDKKLYVWGSTAAMLGNGAANASPVPLLNVCIQGDVASVHTSPSHAGVITTQGVYLWGTNNESQANPAAPANVVSLPSKVEVGNGNRVDMMALGNNFSLVRTTDGAVYGWGGNETGQLGLGHVTRITAPTRIESLSARNVVRIDAAFNRALCATDDGKWFAWGASVGITGTDTQAWSVPHQINQNDLIIDASLRIESLHLGQFAQCGFAVFGSSSWVSSREVENTLATDLSTADFNNPQFSDITVVVKGAEKCIHASKYVLCARSKYFMTMFSRDMKETREGEVVIEGTSYEAVLELMRYLHTGVIDISEGNVLGILQIAMRYDILPLVAKASIFIESVLNFKNCFSLLIESDRIVATPMKRQILNYICDHFKVLGRSEGMETLPPSLLLEIIRLEATSARDSDVEDEDDENI